MRPSPAVAMVVVAATTIAVVEGEIYGYHLKLGAYGSQNNLRYRQSGMFSPHDAPSNSAPGNGHSYLDYGSLQFVVTDSDYTDWDSGKTNVDVAVFEADHFAELGEEVKKDMARQYCCTAWVKNHTGCHPIRSLITSENHDINASIAVYQVQVPHNSKVPVTLKGSGKLLSKHEKYHKYKVRDTGLYTLLLANCDNEYPATIVVTGSTVWMNPYGYLPGELYGMMPFFGVLAGSYVLLTVVWLLLLLRNSKELMLLQFWISLVLFLGALETCIKFFDYVGWNKSGGRDVGALASGLVFGVTKRAVSRILVLMVSLGYGVVKPSLGHTMLRIMILGTAYFVLAMCYDLLVNLPSNNKMVGDSAFMDSLTMLVLLMSLVDVGFYMWVLTALIQTIQYLDLRKQNIKLQLFRRFRTVLILSVVFSVSWAIYTMTASVKGYFEDHWKSQWNVNAVWEVLYLFVLSAVCFLWMPSANSQRYAYSMELATFDPDEEEDADDDLEEDGELGGGLEEDGSMLQGEEPSVVGQFEKAITGSDAVGGEKLN